MGRFVANKSTHLHPPKEDISVEIAVTITGVNGPTRISVKVTRPDSRIPMLFRSCPVSRSLITVNPASRNFQ